MLRTIVRLAAGIAVSTVFIVSGAHSAGIQCDVLQYKHGRIYLGVGHEQNVYPGCRFVVTHDKDTIYAGKIENSYLGVSLSLPTFGLADTVHMSKYQATVTPAAVDSLSRIELACYGLEPYELIRPTSDILVYDSILGGIQADTTSAGNRVWLCHGEPYRLDWDLANGIYDGSFASATLPERAPSRATPVSAAAPFMAVLVPNLSKKTSSLPLVTTSLYYRFDVGRLWPTFFQSEMPLPVNRLYIAGETAPRNYDYDSEKGRLLVTKERNVPSRVTISVENPRLVKVAEYFADILSRDKIRVEVKHHYREADLFLLFIPVVDSDPAISLWRVAELLRRQQPDRKADIEALTIIENYLHSARTAGDVATAYHFYRLADRTLQSDLGVFPLFRPIIYFVPGGNLKNVRFDESGYLDLSSLTKIVLPPIGWEK